MELDTEALDRHITGNYGEDQFIEEDEMTCIKCGYSTFDRDLFLKSQSICKDCFHKEI